MTIQKGNALLANRAGKSSAPLLAPSVSQGSALHQVLSRLQGVKRSGTGYVALCPAHNDRHPSLSIDELSDGRVLLHCWAGCDTESIVSAIGLTMSDLFPQSGRKPSRHRKTKAERQEEDVYKRQTYALSASAMTRDRLSSPNVIASSKMASSSSLT